MHCSKAPRGQHHWNICKGLHIGVGLPSGTADTTGALLSPDVTGKTGCTGMFSTFLDAILAASSAAFLAFFSAFSC
jgi:hypothetical protein